MAIHYGTNGNDVIDGGNGTDDIYGLDGDDIIYGGNGGDILDGGAGNDQIYGQNGHENITGGQGDDLIDGNNGFDTVYFSGPIDKYTFFASAGYLHIVHDLGIAGDGHDQVIRVERLVFADRVIDLDSHANRPVARDDFVFINEDTGTHGSGSASVLDNDFDFDGDAMTVTPATLVGAYGTLTLNADGTYTYTLSAAAQALAAGALAEDSFNYTVSDNDGSDTGTLVFKISGLNDAPTADPDSATTGENEVALIDVLANDEDIDDGAVLTVTAASAPAGQGTASVVGNQVQFDPGGDFESLAVGESVDVQVSYAISDEHGATDSSTLTVTVTGANDGPAANPDVGAAGENGIVLFDVGANDTDVDNGAVLTVTATSVPPGKGSAVGVGSQIQFDPGTAFDALKEGEVEVLEIGYTITDEHGASSSSTLTLTITGTNDGPVANPDSRTIAENTAVVVDVLANDVDVDHDAVVTVVAASGPAGKGSVTIVENEVRFDPGTDFVHLASGDSEQVVIDYTIADEFGIQSSSTLTITVQGRDEGTTNTGTEDSDTIVGTPGDDTLDALGGDDSVFGQAGNDLIFGGNGDDFLNGEQDDDIVDGGSGQDVMSGGDGNDQLLGGAGLDQLFGDSGDDVIEGGGDGDVLSGGDGNDQLSGQAGHDSLVGGVGDDALAGGDGDDTLSDFFGVNSLTGGIGQDFITASSADGAQTIDGGDGNDTIRHYFRSSASTITTGSGSDTIEIAQADVGTEAITVTDFTAGAGGDVFRLSGEDGALLGLLEGWDGSSNPFGSGFLRLQQDGTDTLLQWDRDGSGTGSDWETLVVFENSDADNFTGANFEPAYPPDGSDPAGVTITGTAEDDILSGTVGADTIDALAGNDYVSGNSGGDQIGGGDGFDTLDGDGGNDVIDGGNDDDNLSGGNGDDQLLGQAGNDSLDGGGGDDSLAGGEGDDTLSDLAGANSLSGGLGNDFIVAGSADGAQTVDGGDGNDSIRFHSRNFASVITTGAGSDTIELAGADQGSTAVTVTDFTPGAGGDRVRLSGDDSSVLGLLVGWDGSSNPFGSGHLRLQQSGADTLLQWDRDGSGSESDWETLIVFQGRNAGAFTEANFTPAYHPDGSEPGGQTITGTAEDDSLIGTIGDDTINALAGSDFVSGGSGADQIDGGDGADFLHGDADDDVIVGGNDDDMVSGEDGNDDLSGQAGNDSLFGDAGDDTLDGGDGDDTLADFAGVNSLTGGLGNDFIVAGSADGVQTISAGDGNDSIRHHSRHFASTIATGTGSDTIELAFADQGSEAITVSDFTAGAGGDRIRLSGDDGALLGLLDGWDGSSNPFGSGFLRLQQDGADTLLQWDRDGSGTGSGWETLIVLSGTDADDFTEANFEPGYHPDGSDPAGATITGTAGDDALVGTVGADTVDALAGNDFVAGGAGGDQVNGGDGFDQLYGEAGNDMLDGGGGDDLASGGDGNDVLAGQLGNDNLFGDAGDDTLAGGDGADNLEGAGGDDALGGGDGNDYLSGGLGLDVLTGGIGADDFAFQDPSSGADEIADFASGVDRILVSASGFGGGLTPGGSVSLVSGADPTASGEGGQFLYDTDDGRLLWDADGTGSGAAELIAILSSAPPLVSSDFFVTG